MMLTALRKIKACSYNSGDFAHAIYYAGTKEYATLIIIMMLEMKIQQSVCWIE